MGQYILVVRLGHGPWLYQDRPSTPFLTLTYLMRRKMVSCLPVCSKGLVTRASTAQSDVRQMICVSLIRAKGGESTPWISGRASSSTRLGRRPQFDPWRLRRYV